MDDGSREFQIAEFLQRRRLDGRVRIPEQKEYSAEWFEEQRKEFNENNQDAIDAVTTEHLRRADYIRNLILSRAQLDHSVLMRRLWSSSGDGGQREGDSRYLPSSDDLGFAAYPVSLCVMNKELNDPEIRDPTVSGLFYVDLGAGTIDPVDDPDIEKDNRGSWISHVNEVAKRSSFRVWVTNRASEPGLLLRATSTYFTFPFEAGTVSTDCLFPQLSIIGRLGFTSLQRNPYRSSVNLFVSMVGIEEDIEFSYRPEESLDPLFLESKVVDLDALDLRFQTPASLEDDFIRIGVTVVMLVSRGWHVMVDLMGDSTPPGWGVSCPSIRHGKKGYPLVTWLVRRLIRFPYRP